MGSNRTYQVHANGNADHGDLALRVTITEYDEAGYQVATSTWRRHVKDLWFEGNDWQAYSVTVELAKLMAHSCGTSLAEVNEIDVPLF